MVLGEPTSLKATMRRDAQIGRRHGTSTTWWPGGGSYVIQRKRRRQGHGLYQ